MREVIQKELAAFNTFGKEGKRLILVNLLYAAVFPFIIIFSTAFVNRATGSQIISIVNGFGFGVGLVFGNLTNGLLLKNGWDIRKLFSLGMILSMGSTLCMMLFVDDTIGYYIFFFGLMTGYGNGFYWSNREYVSFMVTNETNRNFYASIDFFFITLFNAVVPFVFGTLIISFGRDTGWFNEIQAYQGCAAFMLLLMLYAVTLVLKSKFKSPKISRFTYWKFSSHWKTHRFLMTFLGFVQSGFMFFMPLLILNVVGDETVLGKIEVSAAMISIAVIYILGRITAPKHRFIMMLAGAFLLIAGGSVVANTIENNELWWFSMKIAAIGVIFMKVMQVCSEPMINVSNSATNLSDIEKASKNENRDSYTYVFDNDIFVNLGRILGGAAFIFIELAYSPETALQYIFLVLGCLQIISAYLIRKQNQEKIHANAVA